MNNKNWYKLNLDISDAIRSDFDFEDLILNNKGNQDTKTALMWAWNKLTLTDIVTPEWLLYMKSLGLDIFQILVFYRKQHLQEIGAHIDGGAVIDNREQKIDVAFNWIIGNDDSQMIWYKIINATDTNIRTTPVNTRYIRYSFADVEEIERHCIGATPTLVRVDIPHSIECNGARLSISVRCDTSKLFENNDYSWEQIVNYFRKYIKE